MNFTGKGNKSFYCCFKQDMSGLKSGHGCLRNLSSGRLSESVWNSIWLKNKTAIYKVVIVIREVVTRRDLELIVLTNNWLSTIIVIPNSGSDTITILVGNKCDLEDKREVDEADIRVCSI